MRSDTTLKAVVNYLEQSWPDKKKMSQALLSYWHVKDELGVQNGLLMRSCRLVIPASMKLEILDKLHALGTSGLQKQDFAHEAISKHEPLIPTNFPTRPWQNIGMDLFKFEDKWYLVVIDYYSRFPEMIQLNRLTANVVVQAGVKIAKLILKKNKDPSLGLLRYRSTPLENGYSPAELLMGRKLRTTLSITPDNLNPRLVDSQTLKRKEGRRRKDVKSRYDRRCGARDMEELSEVGTVRRNRFHLRKGDTVQYPDDPSTPTFSGEELVKNEKTPVVDYPSNDSEDGQIRTRSGRIVKPVDRLHY
ncbi:K02A2.6-like [Cordylochernes scorpioides]|uniref:K02A2.6-like n=1 Tax=Cordylochernes scorpioides TaxID=51811 RepID=A0ABY6LX55_9ARAC|nr:K02A2.6-like [Cordylochernes scorpioides]